MKNMKVSPTEKKVPAIGLKKKKKRFPPYMNQKKSSIS